jgi:hypothetical protein
MSGALTISLHCSMDLTTGKESGEDIGGGSELPEAQVHIYRRGSQLEKWIKHIRGSHSIYRSAKEPTSDLMPCTGRDRPISSLQAGPIVEHGPRAWGRNSSRNPSRCRAARRGKMAASEFLFDLPDMHSGEHSNLPIPRYRKHVRRLEVDLSSPD